MAEFTQTVTIDCPTCASEDVVKNGVRNEYQRYLCQDCGKNFRTTGEAHGRQYPAEVIGAALDMYFSGMSYKQIAEHIEKVHNLPEPSKSTVYEWVTGYAEQALDEMTEPEHTPAVGDHWVADEMQLKVGGQRFWNWNVMDAKTRYLLASHLSKGRGTVDAIKVMEKAVEEAGGKLPKTITTDKLGSYITAIHTVMPGTRHIQSEGIYEDVNNNRSERVQGTFRDRTKTMRGLQGRASGQRYLDGFVLDYNLFRKHEALGGQTPGEVAQVNAPYGEWADVTRDRVQQALRDAVPSRAKPGSAAKAAEYRSDPKKARHSGKNWSPAQIKRFHDRKMMGPGKKR